MPRDAFDPGPASRLPAGHLPRAGRRPGAGRGQGPGRAAPRSCARSCRRRWREAARGLTRSGLRSWDIGTLPREFSHGRVRAYPALADAGDAVDVRLFDTRGRGGAEHAPRHAPAAAAPGALRAPGPIASNLPVQDKLALSRSPYPGAAALLDDCAAAAADEIIARAGGPAWDEAGLRAARRRPRASGLAARDRAGHRAAPPGSLAEAHEVEVMLAGTPRRTRASRRSPTSARSSTRLIYPGFISDDRGAAAA